MCTQAVYRNLNARCTSELKTPTPTTHLGHFRQGVRAVCARRGAGPEVLEGGGPAIARSERRKAEELGHGRRHGRVLVLRGGRGALRGGGFMHKSTLEE
jgi:hypothetical protein